MAKDPLGSKALGQALSMATNMAAALFVGYFLGNWLDGKFDTSPWLTIIFFLLGTATGLKMVYQSAFGGSMDEDISSEKAEGQRVGTLKEGLEQLREAHKLLKEDQRKIQLERFREDYQNRDEADHEK